MLSFQESFPWTQSPFIVNAPMGGFANGALASAVTLAGGFGMIGGLDKPEGLRSELQTAASALSSHPHLSSLNCLPVGLGLLTFILKIEDVLPVIKEFKPAVVWLFAAKELDDYTTWTERIREVSSESKVWIQVGNVGATVQIAKSARPDALCLQGSDAGGHGFEQSASIITLLPEAHDALQRNGLHVPLLASGGIVDGRGVAAALALGAQGVVMGTRFLAAKETTVHPTYRSAILEAQDGGQVTKRAKLFDELRGPNIWPSAYDGRSLVVQSYADHQEGMDLKEVQRLHNEALQGEEKGYALGLKGRAAIWAGAGVGLVNKVESAQDIVESVRHEAREISKKVAAY